MLDQSKFKEIPEIIKNIIESSIEKKWGFKF